MYTIKVTGFKTKAQAEEFISWYEGQGEQDAAVWFECRKDEGVIDIDFMPVESTTSWNGDSIEMKLKI